MYDLTTLTSALRAAPKRVAPQAAPAPPPVAAKPTMDGPLIEFVRRNGRTESVYVRTNKSVKVLHINRDDDGNILSLNLNRLY